MVGTVCIGVAYFAFTGVNIIFPLWLQTTLGYTSTWAGFAMAPVGIVALFIAPVLGGNLHASTCGWPRPSRSVILSGSLLWFSQQNEQASFGQLATPRFIMGFGLSLFFLPLNQIIMAGVSHAELASAAGLSNFVRTISGSISTAACVFMWNDRSEQHYARLTEHTDAGFSGLGGLPGAARAAGHHRRRGAAADGTPGADPGVDAGRQ